MLEQQVEFLCQACLEDKPPQEKSSDPRYCQGCYDFLLEEAKRLMEHGVTKRANWIPQNPANTPQKEKKVVRDHSVIVSTLKNEKSIVDTIEATVASRATGKRGRKFKQLPEDLIRQLNDEGMGCKAIATRLKAGHGVVVSYRTIQRVLSGERKNSIELDI